MSDAASFPAERPGGARVLVVEDDQLQAQALAFILRQEGYEVDVAADGATGLARARSTPGPDLVLVDVALPDLSGVEVARRIRFASPVPIMLVTARREESDKIVGLDAGADDYVTKPFASGELLARVRAQLRRGHAPATPVLATGDLRIDTGTRRVSVDGRAVELSAREFDILRLLAEAGGRVVERQRLFAEVWGAAFFGDERALDVYVYAIRRKIEDDPGRPRYLHTVRGVGYRLADEPLPGRE
jgi:two-component system response regulator RegX3